MTEFRNAQTITPGPDAMPDVARIIRVPAHGDLTVTFQGDDDQPGRTVTFYYMTPGETIYGRVTHILEWDTSPREDFDTRPVARW